jgi:hypothetical protein
LGATSVAIQNTTYAPTLVINQGGTYSGSWEGELGGYPADNNFRKPAVSINTTEPVILENCYIRSSYGMIQGQGLNLTIRNCRGYGLDPGVAGQDKGFFLSSGSVGSLTAEHNYIEGTAWGFQLWTSKARSSTTGPIIVRYNKIKNLDGLASDGAGGRITTANPNANSNSFFRATNHDLVFGADIGWNEVINEPYKSATNDVLDLQSTPGTATSPVDIHDNYFHGHYAPVPSKGNGATPGQCLPSNPTCYGKYIAGVITIDGGPADTAATATSFLKIRNNQLVNTWGHIMLGSGHDNEAYGNRVVSTGQLADGTWFSPSTYFDTGISSWDAYDTGAGVFYNNPIHDNVVGRVSEWTDANDPGIYVAPPGQGTAYLYVVNNSVPGCSGATAALCTNNIVLPMPITSATEANEGAMWQQKVASNKVVLGPVHPAVAANCVFDWAERTYPQFFSPAGAASATMAPYYYRYYAGTGAYLATSWADNHLWLLGAAFGGLLDVGARADFLAMTGCAG